MVIVVGRLMCVSTIHMQLEESIYREARYCEAILRILDDSVLERRKAKYILFMCF